MVNDGLKDHFITKYRVIGSSENDINVRVSFRDEQAQENEWYDVEFDKKVLLQKFHEKVELLKFQIEVCSPMSADYIDPEEVYMSTMGLTRDFKIEDKINNKTVNLNIEAAQYSNFDKLA